MNNYHTHTYRCGHAFNNEEEMVKSAIALGIKELGFSEHVPLPHYRRSLLKAFPLTLSHPITLFEWIKTFINNGPSMKMSYTKKDEHEEIIRSLKIKYQKDITIYQGYECEYLEEYLPYYKHLLNSHEVDYLILGNHFDRHLIHNCYYGKKVVDDKMLDHYCEQIIKAMHTGLFSYIAHPDLFMMGRRDFDEHCREISYAICKEAKKCNIPLEVNAGGIRRGKRKISGKMVYPYTNDFFFEIVSEIGNDIILGFDAHSIDDFNHNDLKIMEQFVEKHHLKRIEKIKIEKEK